MYTNPLPVVSIKRKAENGVAYVYDSFRKRWVRNTPEEWVRQQLLNFLTVRLGYPPGRLAVETAIAIQGKMLRCDAVVYNQGGEPSVIIECKAPDIPLDSKVVNQAMDYRYILKSGGILCSNGISHLTMVFLPDGCRTVFDGLMSYPELSDAGVV